MYYLRKSVENMDLSPTYLAVTSLRFLGSAAFHIFQNNMSLCLIISVFCKSFEPICEPICEPEITPLLYHLENQNKQFHVQSMFSVQFTNLTKRGNKHCRALEILKKIWISHLFSCMY